MKLLIRGNSLFADNLLFSHVGVPNAQRDQFQPGSYEVTARYSHDFERDLPHADGLGWIGADAACAVVLGRVVDGHGQVLPCRVTEARLVGLLETLEERGGRCTLEINHG